MNIVIILPNLTGGGAERLHLNLAKDWISHGHNVDFILMQKRGELLSIFPSEIDILDLGISKLSKAVIPLAKSLKNKKPDIILSAMWPLTSITVLSWILSGRLGRLFLSEHIVLSIECEKNIGIPLHLLRIIVRSTYRFADGIIAVSKGVKKDLCRISSLDKGTVSVIYNPVSGGYHQDYDVALLRRDLWGSDSDYNILSVGSLKEQKDHASLIKAFSLLPNNINAKLVILGEGPLRSDLEKLVIQLKLQNNIVLYGFVDNPYPWYISADLFVLSSKWEGFKEHYDTYGYKKTIVFYGVNKMLSSLKKSNLKMYIATNKRILPTMKIVNLFKWNNIFDGIFALDSFLPVARSKQEILLKIVEKYNIEPDDALYIGDMKSDMIAAKESNIEYVMVTWGNGQNFNFECDSVDSPLNLRDIIIQDT